MASDNRDWYRDWWRKKTGYVERSTFRRSHAENERAAKNGRWRKVYAALALYVLFVALFRFFR